MWEIDFICDEMHCNHEEEELKNNHYNVLVSSYVYSYLQHEYTFDYCLSVLY